MTAAPSPRSRKNQNPGYSTGCIAAKKHHTYLYTLLIYLNILHSINNLERLKKRWFFDVLPTSLYSLFQRLNKKVVYSVAKW